MDYDQAAKRILELMRAGAKADPRMLEACILAVEIAKSFLWDIRRIADALEQANHQP